MRFLTGTLVLTAVLLQACAAPADKDSASQAETGNQAPAYVPQQGLSDKERFREVLYLLEEGEPVGARAELMLFLQSQPGSDTGSDLLAQIDTPADVYYPAENREITLQSGWSLSNVAKHYLGDPLQFHALAKYNGIVEPRKLTAGQSIRVPLTDEARAVFALEDAGEAAPPMTAGEGEPAAPDMEEAEAIVDTAPAPEPEPEPEPFTGPTTAEKVDALHREALDAYRAQDLDKAITLWDEVLELDPTHDSARLYRSQAVELKKKLSNLL